MCRLPLNGFHLAGRSRRLKPAEKVQRRRQETQKSFYALLSGQRKPTAFCEAVYGTTSVGLWASD